MTSSTTMVDEVLSLGANEVGDNPVATFEQFARAYLKRLPDVDLAELDAAALHAEIVDLLAFVDSRQPGERVVRAFHPTEEADGYTTVGSVLEVVTEDCPFLVDSVTAAVTREGYDIVRHLHPVIGTVRNADGTLSAVTGARASATRESVQHFELARVLDADEAKRLEEIIFGVLGDIDAVVRDFEPMRRAVVGMSETAKDGSHHYDFEDIAETVAFLDWLLEDNFVFLGYREYRIEPSDAGRTVTADVSTGLGIFSQNGTEASSVALDDLPQHLRERYLGTELMVITKTNRHATVHRDARMDYVGLRRMDDDGLMIAELRLLGLFTSKAYMTPASEIPVLRRKLGQVIQHQDVIEGSHDYKSIVQLFESFPKDDLFAMPVDSLSEMLGDLVETEELESVRLFVRRDRFKRFVTILVTVPRDRFNADLRKALQELFLVTFGGHAIDYRLALGESGDARIHFSVWVDENAPLDVDVPELERTVLSLARNWEDRVIEELATRVSESDARRLGERWTGFFPEYYETSTGLEIAAGDILNLQSLADTGSEIVVGLQNETTGLKAPAAPDDLSRITIYRSSGKLNLSEMMPLIEDLGLVVVEEVPTRLKDQAGTFIHDFGVLTLEGEQLDIGRVGGRIASAIEAVLLGEAE